MKAASTAVAAPITRQNSEIFKLDIDCYEEAFDYMPFRDLVSIGKTCKYFRKVAGDILKQTYSTIAIDCENDYKVFRSSLNGCYNAHHMYEFVDEISIYSLVDDETEPNKLNQTASILLKLTHLKKMNINGFEINQTQMSSISSTLNKIEALRLENCSFDGDLKEIVFKFCPNLKHLAIIEASEFINNTNTLTLECKTLERFEFTDYLDYQFNGLTNFLDLNANIKNIGIPANWLMTYENWATTTTKATFDNLAIQIFSLNSIDFVSFCNLLNKLHRQGFHKELKLYFFHALFYRESLNARKTILQLKMINGLTKLSIHISTKELNNVTTALCDLKSLNELCIHFSDNNESIDWMETANSLTNIERIYFDVANIDDILPFISQSRGLNEIKIDDLRDGHLFNEQTKVINLVALNRARSQLPNARKIIFYVPEYIYLKTKWKLKQIDFSSIRLMRSDSHKWNIDFNHY